MTNQIKLMDNNTNIYKIILMLAWPAVVEQLLQTIVNYVDTAMVGAIGVNATAAIGVTSSTIWMLNGFMQAVGVGYSVQVARHIGAGETEEAKSVIRQAVLAVLVLGAGLSAILMFFIAPNLPILMKVEPEVAPMAESYLRIIGMSYVCNMALIVCSNIMRCAGDTKTPMKYNILTNLINVVGNFFLIYPSREIVLLGREMVLPRAGLGVAGAAISTAIAISFSGICMLRILFCRQSAVQISLTDNFKPQGHI
ncbi:MAG: MATE family efflux transporter, partial [Pygmaiobacter sp.]